MTIPAYEAALLQAKAYRSLRAKVSETLSSFNVSPPEWSLIGLLQTSRSSLRPADLSDKLGVEAPLVTRMVQTLERRGLVHRSASTVDRRAKDISLTEEGRALVRRIEKTMRDTLDPLFSSVSSDDIAAYLRVLRVMSVATD